MTKKDQWNFVLITLLIAIITGFHYGMTASPWPVHDFYRRLYYVPIILAAFHSVPMIQADADRLKQAIMNLMLNGIKAMEEGGTLTVALEKEDDHQALIVVRDEGKGINEEDQPYIFDPFFTTKDGGTGLGLSVTYRIIEEHQGSIEVNSHKGEGTEFRLHLPLAEEEDKSHET